MGLELKFNDPLVLKGYLNQALPQMKIDSEKIVVGDKGGLVYCLFEPNRWEQFPKTVNVDRLSKVEFLAKYFGGINQYFKAATTLAEGYKFKKVSVYEGEISTEIDDTNPYSLGVGDAEIESVERLEEFLKMVKDIRKPLEDMYNQIESLAQELSK